MDKTDIQFKGVRGWLLLLCVNLTILDPFSILFNLIFVTNLSKPYFDKQAGLLKLIFINGTCSIGLAVFSIYAGVSLWKVLPSAPAVAKKYLLAVSIYSIISLFIPALVGLTDESDKSLSGNNIINGLLTILYATVWYLYLKKSRRVQITYNITPTS